MREEEELDIRRKDTQSKQLEQLAAESPSRGKLIGRKRRGFANLKFTD